MHHLFISVDTAEHSSFLDGALGRKRRSMHYITKVYMPFTFKALYRFGYLHVMYISISTKFVTCSWHSQACSMIILRSLTLRNQSQGRETRPARRQSRTKMLSPKQLLKASINASYYVHHHLVTVICFALVDMRRSPGPNGQRGMIISVNKLSSLIILC